MFSVTILLPMNDNYFSNRLALETNIERAGISNCQVIVYNNGGDSKIKEWCLNDLKDKITYLESETIKKNSDIINEMFDWVSNDYIVIIPEPIILPLNWLYELVKQNNTIYNTGISSISINSNRGNLTPKINNYDESVFVWQNDNNLVYGVICFNKGYLELIGGFDADLHNGFEFLNFSYRLSVLGFWNYYISGISATSIKEYDPLCFYETTNEEWLASCKNVNTRKKILIPFRKESEVIKNGYSKINELADKLKSQIKKPFYKPISNLFGIELIYITNDEIKQLDEFSASNGLKYIIRPTDKTKGVQINFHE